jgi:hypothetical protein
MSPVEDSNIVERSGEIAYPMGPANGRANVEFPVPSTATLEIVCCPFEVSLI